MNFVKRISLFLTPLSLLFLSVGKFVFAFLVVFRIFVLVASKRVSVWESWFLRCFLMIFGVFVIWACLGFFNENDWRHILRNNFSSLFFFLGSLTIFWGVRSVDDLICRMAVLVRVLSYGLLSFIILYTLRLFGVDVNALFSDPYFGRLGYNFTFSGPLIEFSGLQFEKVFSGISGVYIYLIPFCLLVLRDFWFLFITLVLAVLMSSFMFYLVLVFYVLVFFVTNFRYFAGYAFFGFVFSALVFLGFVYGPLKDMPVTHKVVELVSGDYDYSAQTSQLPSTIGVRVIQFNALLTEVSSSPVLGKGLGYQSEIYNDIRSNWKPLKEFNKSMYELQFMDVLMKFGVVGSVLIFILYVFLPLIIGFKWIFHSKVVLSFFVGHIGLVIYSLNNGNYFYSYATMFCWGLTVYFMLFYRVSFKGRSLR